MTKKDILDAALKVRAIDHCIPDENKILDYMRDAAIEKLEEEEKLSRFKKQLLSDYEMLIKNWELKQSNPNT